MDLEKHLILVNDEDKTEDISHCEYRDGKWYVTYKNNGRTYPYIYLNVQWLKNPTSLDATTTIVYKNNQPVSGIRKLFDFADYIRVIFVTGYKKVYRRQDIKLEQSCLKERDAQKCYEYLKQLAEKVSVKDEGDKSFLGKQYEKMTFISPSSVLAQYLNPGAIKTSGLRQLPLFPFGFNLSQKIATERALSNQLSVIEGPPGTGKTQTILNIIANAVINKKTVAVVSNNNAATANVLDKLQAYGVDFIAAYLGNSENREKFFNEQRKGYPDMGSWQLSDSDYRSIKEAVEKAGQELERMLELKNRAAMLKQELSDLAVERKYFEAYYYKSNSSVTAFRSLFRLGSQTLLALWLDYQQRVEQDRPVNLLYKIKNLIRYGIIGFSFYKNLDEEIIAYLQKLYYERKTDELNQQIQDLAKKLEEYHFEQTMREYSSNSLRLFKAELAKRFGKGSERTFTPDALWKETEFSSFIEEYPVILSTTHSLRNCACSNYLFDYVVMDEASQVDIVTGALALSCAKSAVIVGDLNQLPNVVPRSIAEETDLIFHRYSLSKPYRYASNSMLSSVAKLFNDVPRTLLREHYRCHPKIIGFCNQKFYHDALIVLTEAKEHDAPLVIYKTAEGSHARGNFNQRQIDVILEEVLPQQDIDGSRESVGVISPYRLQTDRLKEALRYPNIEIDTVHKFQGREKDVIILSTVANEINDFIDNPNLLNVAVSRAAHKLVVVISDELGRANSNLGDLVRYIEYNNCEIHDSQIYSVFDLLYHVYSEKLYAFLKSHKRVSEYASENLMSAVIEKVLALAEFQSLNYVMHQPLKMLIRNSERLDEDECRFAMNILTHTDFLIFHKLDKMPVLVVEVDGYAFHASNPKQLARDKLKDAILKKYCIPILRIRTNESGEEKRLYNTLSQILNNLV